MNEGGTFSFDETSVWSNNVFEYFTIFKASLTREKHEIMCEMQPLCLRNPKGIHLNQTSDKFKKQQ